MVVWSLCQFLRWLGADCWQQGAPAGAMDRVCSTWSLILQRALHGLFTSRLQSKQVIGPAQIQGVREAQSVVAIFASSVAGKLLRFSGPQFPCL